MPETRHALMIVQPRIVMALAEICDTSDTRPQLHGIYLRPHPIDGVLAVAMNDNVMMVVQDVHGFASGAPQQWLIRPWADQLKIIRPRLTDTSDWVIFLCNEDEPSGAVFLARNSDPAEIYRIIVSSENPLDLEFTRLSAEDEDGALSRYFFPDWTELWPGNRKWSAVLDSAPSLPFAQLNMIMKAAKPLGCNSVAIEPGEQARYSSIRPPSVFHLACDSGVRASVLASQPDRVWGRIEIGDQPWMRAALGLPLK